MDDDGYLSLVCSSSNEVEEGTHEQIRVLRKSPHYKIIKACFESGRVSVMVLQGDVVAVEVEEAEDS